MFLAVFLVFLAYSTVSIQEQYIVAFERSGGFAGINYSVKIDSDTLSNEEFIQLKKLIEDTDFFSLKANEISSTNTPDQFNYKIEIVKGDLKNTIEFGDSNIPDRLAPLVNYLSNKARKRE